jgi:thioredoxin-related protein
MKKLFLLLLISMFACAFSSSPYKVERIEKIGFTEVSTDLNNIETVSATLLLPIQWPANDLSEELKKAILDELKEPLNHELTASKNSLGEVTNTIIVNYEKIKVSFSKRAIVQNGNQKSTTVTYDTIDILIPRNIRL